MAQQQTPLPCALCDRSFPRDRLTRHHCKPKSKGGTSDDVRLICAQCHGMIHATYTNATLAALYPTLEKLRAAPELAAFLVWVRKQPPTRRKHNKARRRKV
ncbi:MAG: HNH endonuclease signature motif containing protein [Pirellulaceae bacterium]|nr:HNH endonuclease signature motif containing protein [Pirellulaceae bacterium]